MDFETLKVADLKAECKKRRIAIYNNVSKNVLISRLKAFEKAFEETSPGHDGVAAIPQSDGSCGPTNGPQCESCKLAPLANPYASSAKLKVVEQGSGSDSEKKYRYIEHNIPDEELIDEIGEDLELEMWNKRDQTKEYDFPGAREGGECVHGDPFVVGNIVIYKNQIPLLLYNNLSYFRGVKTLYTLNLLTLKPTKNSKIQKLLSHELVERIKKSKISWFMSF